jgi:adenylate kinase
LANTLLGKSAQHYMDSGRLVPDELVIDIVKDRLRQSDCLSRGWLLDGFPRTLAQADALAAEGLQPHCVIVLDVPEKVLVERVAGRRLDPQTGKVYHSKFNPPPNETIAARLIQRSDDTEEKAKKRYQDFVSHIQSIKDCYSDKLVNVNGTQSKEQVSECILREVENMLGRHPNAGKTHNPLNIIIAGAPAAGKGTQCEIIKGEYGVVHLSTGDILRAAVAQGTELGVRAKEYMDAGKLVPDEVIIDVVRERLRQKDCIQQGWLLDGFPRTAAQAQALEAAGLKPDCCLLLDVPEEVLVERLEGRRLDPLTGKVYHLKFNPPPSEDIAQRLTRRSDDTAEKMRVRYQDFTKHVSSIEQKYRDRLFKIDGTKSQQTVSTTIKEIVSKVRDDKYRPRAPPRKSDGVKRFVGVSLFVLLDHVIARVLKSSGLSFPSSLVGMMLIFVGMLTLRERSVEVSRQALIQALPAVTFIRYWLPVFFVPSLVMFPLRLQSISSFLAPIALLTVIGFFGSLITTAVVSEILPGPRETPSNPEEQMTSPVPTIPLETLAAAVAGSFMIAVFAHQANARALNHAFEVATGLSATLCGIALGRRMPKQLQTVAHPIVSCTLFTLGVLKLYSGAVQQSFASILKVH